jgi:hypothetical protein
MRRPAALPEVLENLRLALITFDLGTDATVQLAPTEDELPLPPAEEYITVVPGPAVHQDGMYADEGPQDYLVLDGTLSVIVWNRRDSDLDRDTSDWTDRTVGIVVTLQRLISQLHNYEVVDSRGDQLLMNSLTFVRLETPPRNAPSIWKPFITVWAYRLLWEL